MKKIQDNSIMKNKKDIEIFMSSRPGKDCKCQVCIFSKSQAPGQPYDLSKCPLWNEREIDKRKKTK